MAGDDLLVGTGIDLSGLRRDRAAVLAQFQTLGGEISRALATKDLLPNLTQQARASTSGVREAYQDVQRAVSATSAQAARAAAEERAARAQVRAELTSEIASLALYGRTVDATNAKAVAAWRSEAAAIRQQAGEVLATREQVLRLDAAIQSTERRFASVARQANIRNIGPPIDQAATSFANLNTSASKWSPIAQRAANTAVAVGFGLEAIARSGDAADSGLRTALRSVASFAALFGPEGLIVSGVAVAAAAILDIFSKARDEVEKTRKKFDDEIRAMAKNADVIGLEVKLQDVTIDKTDLERQRAQVEKFLSGFSNARRKSAAALALLPGTSPLDGLIAANELNLKTLKIQIEELDREQKTLSAKILNPLPAVRRPRGLQEIKVTALSDTKQAQKDLEDLAKDVAAVIALEKAARAQKITIPTLAASEVSVFDRVAAAVKRYGNQTGDTSAKVHELMGQVQGLDAVLVELERRKLAPLGGVPDLPPVQVRGVLDTIDIKVPDRDRIVPVTADVTVDPSSLSLGFKNALKDAQAAQTDLDLAQLIGDRQKIADASENAAVAEAKLRKEASDLAGVIAASSADDATKAAAVNAIAEAMKGLSAESDAAARHLKAIRDRLSGLSSVVQGIQSVGDALGGLGPQADGALAGIDRLLSSVTALQAAGSALSLGGIGSGLGVIGSVFSIIGSLRQNTGPSQTDILIRELNDRLADLTLKIGDISKTPDTLSQTARALEDQAVQRAAQGTPTFVGTGTAKHIEFRVNEDEINRQLERFGLTMADVEKVARDQGITLRDRHGKILTAAFDRVAAILHETAVSLTQFKNTVDDVTFVQNARTDILDLNGKPQAAFDNAVATIDQFTAGVGKGLEGIDITTREGRLAAKAEIRRLFELAAANKLTVDQLKGLSVKEFVNFLLDADHALDTFADTAKQAAGEMVNVANGFAVAKRVFDTLRASAEQKDQASIRTGAPPPAPNPTPIPTGAATAASASASKTSAPAPVPVSLTVTVTSDASETPDQLRKKVRQAFIEKAQTISRDVVASVQAAMPI